MSFPTITGVALVVGSTNFSFTSAEPSSIRAGSLLIVQGYSPVEISSLTEDGSKTGVLDVAWPYSNVSGGTALIVPLEAALFEKVKELVTLIQSSNTSHTELLSAIATLATTAGLVTIKDASGVEHSVQGFLNLGSAATKNMATLDEAKAGLAGVLPDAAQVPEIINEQAKKGFANVDSGVLRLLLPGGAAYKSPDSTVTGALKITLPNSWTSSMLTIRVRVYEYYTGKSFEVLLGGYSYSGGFWIGTTAVIIGGTEVDRNFNVRFGHDGTKCCIYIGEVDSSWSYPQVAVMDVVVGFSGVSVGLWSSGWSVDLTSTFGAISTTLTKNQIGKYVDGILK